MTTEHVVQYSELRFTLGDRLRKVRRASGDNQRDFAKVLHATQEAVSAWEAGRNLSRALGPGWSGHTLRHRFGTRVYAASGDLLSLQQLLGHSSPATTRQYVALSDEALRRAAASAA